MITKKGLDTRNKIIEKSAELFNTKGYAGTSISDI
ncbi:MAG: TetR/AcrR family transcriptional regulator, partial [Bacteroidota bacterium]